MVLENDAILEPTANLLGYYEEDRMFQQFWIRNSPLFHLSVAPWGAEALTRHW
jgi:hypothetical protein